MTVIWRRVSWAVLLAVLSVACSAEPVAEELDATEPDVEDDADRSRMFPAQVDVRVRGAVDLDWSGVETIDLTRVGAADLDANLVSLGFAGAVSTGDPREGFRWGFDLVEGYADQPGTFTITDQPVAGGLFNVALFEFFRTTGMSLDQAAEEADLEVHQNFRTVLQPCTLQIGPGESTGTLDCPALADQAGAQVSLHATWEER